VRGQLIRGALALSGGLLLVWVVQRIGFESIVSAFSQLSWRLAIVMVFPCLLFKVFDALGWSFAFPVDRVGLLTLVRIRVIGQAIDATTPTATIGGDATKAWFLRNEVDVRETLSSLLIAKTTMTTAQGLFLLLGVVIAQRTIGPNSRILLAMQVLLGLELLAVAGFVAVQMMGPFSAGHGLLRRLGMLAHADLGATATDIDRTLATFYRRRRGRLALSVTCCLLGWVASAAEVWLILDLLGVPVSVPTALVVEAFSAGIRFATFFVPGQVGFAEGGAVATFLALGLSGAAGLSFSVVRRAREVAWIGVGFALAGAHRSPPPVLNSRRV
jgi:uncharacterized protein (TIRG00374 family)